MWWLGLLVWHDWLRPVRVPDADLHCLMILLGIADPDEVALPRMPWCAG